MTSDVGLSAQEKLELALAHEEFAAELRAEAAKEMEKPSDELQSEGS